MGIFLKISNGDQYFKEYFLGWQIFSKRRVVISPLHPPLMYFYFFQGISDLPDYKKIVFSDNPPIPFEEILPDASPIALDLLKQFLVYPSKERLSAKQVRFNAETKKSTTNIHVVYCIDKFDIIMCEFGFKSCLP
jgi:hypothetical protein